MTEATRLTWWHLGILTKRRYDRLLELHDSLDVALLRLSPELLRTIGCREETIPKVMTRFREMKLPDLCQEIEKKKLTLISIEDEAYPHTLRSITDPPVFLSTCGDLSLLSQPMIALVGTRAMSAYGERVTSAFVTSCTDAGLVTVSGLAYGIDATVARETLLAGSHTIAVLGHGMGMLYPKAHRVLADDIVAKGGLLLSEFPIDTKPDHYTFPARNRIIAGLARATVVLEATDDSGSLITAELATDYGRDVFAVPGNMFDANYAGCHALIRKHGAHIASSPVDVLTSFGITSGGVPKKEHVFESSEEAHVFSALTLMPQSVDDLVLSAKRDTSMISATLTLLELKGAARSAGEGLWVRV